MRRLDDLPGLWFGKVLFFIGIARHVRHTAGPPRTLTELASIAILPPTRNAAELVSMRSESAVP